MNGPPPSYRGHPPPPPRYGPRPVYRYGPRGGYGARQDDGRGLPARLSELERLPAHQLLIILSAYAAILLGGLFFLAELAGFFWLSMGGRLMFGGFAWAVVRLIVSLAGGLLMVGVYRQALRGVDNAFVFAFIWAVLMLFGNTGGQIGGVLGILGAAALFLRRENIRL